MLANGLIKAKTMPDFEIIGLALADEVIQGLSTISGGATKLRVRVPLHHLRLISPTEGLVIDPAW